MVSTAPAARIPAVLSCSLNCLAPSCHCTKAMTDERDTTGPTLAGTRLITFTLSKK